MSHYIGKVSDTCMITFLMQCDNIPDVVGGKS